MHIVFLKSIPFVFFQDVLIMKSDGREVIADNDLTHFLESCRNEKILFTGQEGQEDGRKPVEH